MLTHCCLWTEKEKRWVKACGCKDISCVLWLNSVRVSEHNRRVVWVCAPYHVINWSFNKHHLWQWMKVLILGRKTAGCPYSDYQQLPLILHLNRHLNEVEGLCKLDTAGVEGWSVYTVFVTDHHPSTLLIEKERDKNCRFGHVAWQ